MIHKIQIIFIFLLFSSTIFAKSLRIETDDLVKNLSNYTILDTRSQELYKKGHIAKALNFPADFTYENMQKNGQISNPTKMQSFIQKLGMVTDTPIVIYDDGVFFDAARLFWVLEVYGFTNVRLLQIGYDLWKANNYPTSTELYVKEPSNYIVQVNNKRFATKFTTQLAIENPNQIIIDARQEKAYNGLISSSERYGHIPTAINIPGSHNINHQTDTDSLQSLEDLKELYKDIDKGKKVILYCSFGKASSSSYFALRELKYDVANYDGSWNEWGNDFSLPIVKVKEKKIQE